MANNTTETETHTLENIKMESFMAQVLFNGQMVVSMMANLIWVANTVKANGWNLEMIARQTVTKDAMNSIRNMVTVFSNGNLGIPIQEIFPKTWEKDTDKWSGLMEPFTSGCGLKIYRTAWAKSYTLMEVQKMAFLKTMCWSKNLSMTSLLYKKLRK